MDGIRSGWQKAGDGGKDECGSSVETGSVDGGSSHGASSVAGTSGRHGQAQRQRGFSEAKEPQGSAKEGTILSVKKEGRVSVRHGLKLALTNKHTATHIHPNVKALRHTFRFIQTALFEHVSKSLFCTSSLTLALTETAGLSA